MKLNLTAKITCLALLLSFFSFPAFSQKPDEFINEKDSRDIIEFLASQKLRGRVNFTIEQIQAAEFISNKFASFNLEPFQTYSGYYHPFSPYDNPETDIQPNQITWNGKVLSSRQFYYSYTLPLSKKMFMEDFRILNITVPLSRDTVDVYLRDSLPLLVWYKNDMPVDSMTRNSLIILREAKHKTMLIVRHPQAPASMVIEADNQYLSSYLFNVMAVLPGTTKKNELVIIGAHYDHVSKNPLGGSGIFNGANDNASGVAALLQLAKYYALLGPQERSILFVAFAGEELGLHGSKKMVKQINNENIVCMVNIEMIGLHGRAGKKAFFITGANKSSFSDIVSSNILGGGIKIVPEPSGREDLFWRSDNYSFYNTRIPAHSIMCSDDFEPCYHQTCDDARKIDYSNMTLIIRSLAKGLTTIVNGSETPKLK